MPSLEIHDLHVDRGDSTVLRGVSTGVAPESITAVLGRNGAGKTTLVRATMGSLPTRAGDVHLDDVDLTGRPAWKRSRAGLSIVPQGRRVFSNLSVDETLQIVHRRGGALSLNEILDLFPSLQRRLHVRAGRLSGGEQQMLAIARALATAPSIVMLDEPSEGLAPHVVAQLATLIQSLPERGIGVLLAEQNVPLALEVADRISVIEHGVTAFDGDPDELRSRADLQRQLLGV